MNYNQAPELYESSTADKARKVAGAALAVVAFAVPASVANAEVPTNFGQCQQQSEFNQAPGQTGNGPWAPGQPDNTPNGFNGAVGCTK